MTSSRKKTVVELKDAIALDVISTGHSMFVNDVTLGFRKVNVQEFEKQKMVEFI